MDTLKTFVTRTPVMLIATNDALEKWQWERWAAQGVFTKRAVRVGWQPTHILVQEYKEGYSRSSAVPVPYLTGSHLEEIK